MHLRWGMLSQNECRAGKTPSRNEIDLTLFRQWNFPIKLHTMPSGWSIVNIQGSQVTFTGCISWKIDLSRQTVQTLMKCLLCRNIRDTQTRQTCASRRIRSAWLFIINNKVHISQSCADPGFFSGGGGGGVQARRPENSLENVFFVVLILFYSLQRGSNGFYYREN